MSKLTDAQKEDIERKVRKQMFNREINIAFELKHPAIDISIENCTDKVRNAYRNMLYNRNTDIAM